MFTLSSTGTAELKVSFSCEVKSCLLMIHHMKAKHCKAVTQRLSVTVGCTACCGMEAASPANHKCLVTLHMQQLPCDVTHSIARVYSHMDLHYCLLVICM